MFLEPGQPGTTYAETVAFFRAIVISSLLMSHVLFLLSEDLLI